MIGFHVEIQQIIVADVLAEFEGWNIFLKFHGECLELKETYFIVRALDYIVCCA